MDPSHLKLLGWYIENVAETSTELLDLTDELLHSEVIMEIEMIGAAQLSKKANFLRPTLEGVKRKLQRRSEW